MLVLVVSFLFCLYLSTSDVSVFVYHFVMKQHGYIFNGNQNCKEVDCLWITGDTIDSLKSLKSKHEQSQKYQDSVILSLALFNAHSWWEKSRKYAPAICDLLANFSMIESEESKARYGARIFDHSFKYYDGILMICFSQCFLPLLMVL